MNDFCSETVLLFFVPIVLNKSSKSGFPKLQHKAARRGLHSIRTPKISSPKSRSSDRARKTASNDIQHAIPALFLHSKVARLRSKGRLTQIHIMIVCLLCYCQIDIMHPAQIGFGSQTNTLGAGKIICKFSNTNLQILSEREGSMREESAAQLITLGLLGRFVDF